MTSSCSGFGCSRRIAVLLLLAVDVCFGLMSRKDLAQLDYLLRPEVDRLEAFTTVHHFNQDHDAKQKKDRDLQQSTTVTVVIYFDDFPRETGFTLTSNGQTLANYPIGSFGDGLKGEVFVQSYAVAEGQVVTFTITDSYADGIFDPGFYALYYGSATTDAMLLYKEDQFTDQQDQVTLAVLRPETAAPTPAVPTFSPAPTHAPTTCLDPNGNGWEVLSSFRDYEPHFFTEKSAIPSTELCSRHRTYTDCTNEIAEDCQWQFLSIGGLQGKCRVDPIAHCLETGQCQCFTEDFNAGSDQMGDGLLFHAPIALTTRDVSSYANDVYYYETYQTPGDNANQAHPQNENFFISRVDFTGRTLTYLFGGHIPQFVDKTISFNLHYLYMDTPIKGSVWSGLGMAVSIDTSTSPQTLTLNGHTYQLQQADLKKWTCTTVVITSTKFYVAGKEYSRVSELSTPSFSPTLNLGTLSGELFDVRIYQGTLSMLEILELGARCTTPDDPAALFYKRDIENPYFIYGCDADFERLPADEGGPVPTNNIQTYGSGAIATLWMKPEEDPFNEGILLDVPEGEFDEEWFFQQKKLQHYIYERVYFETDMLAMNTEPYRFFENKNEVPVWSETFWNNPCRYINNFNNGWQFPIYGTNIGKLDTSVFDLETQYFTRNAYPSMPFWAHELFHGLQGSFIDVYSGAGSGWLSESSAEYAADFTFPAYRNIISPLAFAPSMPLGFMEYRDAARGTHFMSDELSVSTWIRGGTVYGSWLLWWFLSEHVGMPGTLGSLYSNWYNKNVYIIGEILYVRMLVENNNRDFGDVWSIAAAHMRTWDFPNRGDDYRQSEAEDFQAYLNNPDIQPPIPSYHTVESRKTSAEISATAGTSGQFVAGPVALRPGPNGWNCLTMRNVQGGRVVSITLQWDNGMGFQPNQQPSWISQQQAGCDDDPRFYNSVVVAHNKDTDERRYFKAKGKTPATVSIQTNGNTDIHIILMPNPPTDYMGSIYTRTTDFYDDIINPIPVYSYRYKVDVLTGLPTGLILTPAAPKENGIVKFEPATPGWWPVECTCMDNPNASYERCTRPTFDGIGTNPIPAPAPTPPPNPVDLSESTLPPSSSAPPPGFCFSGHSEVDVKGKGMVSMDSLGVGDEVLVGGNKYERVYSFGHRDELLSAEFLQLLPSKLELSKEHMVFVHGKGFIPASALRVGDTVGDDRIEGIRRVRRQGVYTPYTPSGTIVVNGVLASNYIAFQNSGFMVFGSFQSAFTFQWLDHTFQTPHRIWCHWLGFADTTLESGFSPWSEPPYRVSIWYLKQQPTVMGALFLPFLLLLGLFSLVETLLLNPWRALAMGISAWLLHNRNFRNRHFGIRKG